MKSVCTLLGSILGSIILAFAQPAEAGDLALGRAKAVTCKPCHGLDGIGKLPIYPNISGQKEIYLSGQLRAFRDGVRKDEMMSFVTKNLSDEDIDNLATYYASIKVEVTSPE